MTRAPPEPRKLETLAESCETRVRPRTQQHPRASPAEYAPEVYRDPDKTPVALEAPVCEGLAWPHDSEGLERTHS